MKKSYFIVPAIILLAVFAFFMVSSYGYIEITVNNAQGKTLNYSLKKAGSDKPITIESSASSVKKLVPKGSYEVTVDQAEASYFSVNNVSGFLTSTGVEASLKKENARTFIGDNAAFCMNYNETSSTLYSYTCDGSYTDLQLHVPATSTTPTYTEGPLSPETDLRGVVNVGSDTYVMLEPVQTEENGSSPKAIYKLDADFTRSSWYNLDELSDRKDYRLKNYRDGFIAYSDDLSDVKYYPGLSTPQNITKPPVPGDMEVMDLFIGSDDSLSILMTQQSTNNDAALHSDEEKPSTRPEEGNSKLLVYSKGSWKTYEFEYLYSSGFACGDKLCLLGNGILDVYGTDSESPERLYSIYDAQFIQPTDEGVLIARKHDVLNFNSSTASGYISYSLGKLGFCGLQTSATGYAVCGATSSGASYALYVDLSKTVSDPVDKKILSLLEYPQVSSVSVFRNSIFISPRVGEAEYLPNGEYGYNPEKVNSIKSDISEALDEIGIDQDTYQVRYTL